MESYTSKKQNLIKDYLINNENKHVTAFDIYEYFKKQGEDIGLTTIYRQLEKLTHDGFVNKYVIDSQSSACYEYIGHENCHEMCYHMKCEKCGVIIHLECDEIKNISDHLYEHHNFKLNPNRTVFYGLCEKCLNTCGR